MPGTDQDVRVALSAEPLDPARLEALVKSPEAGAIAVFTGTVRRTNQNREVLRLEYEAYGPMAVAVIEEIVQEARERFAILDIAAHHRVGTLAIGAAAVVVAVAAPHRDAAFAGCRYVIDELKKRAPIWKKEVYRDGESWLSHCP
jgi:molybdopterin synthase catalytic subunit